MYRFIGVALALVILSACGRQEAPEPKASYDFSKDNFVWLEEVEGEQALAWVEEQNVESLGHLESSPVFEPLRERNLEIYNSDERIPVPAMRGDYVYNFWRDEDNIRGRWRRMSLDDYIGGCPTSCHISFTDFIVIADIAVISSMENDLISHRINDI